MNLQGGREPENKGICNCTRCANNDICKYREKAGHAIEMISSILIFRTEIQCIKYVKKSEDDDQSISLKEEE